MNYNDGFQKIVDAIKNKNVAILFGTGLSYNSGVFTAFDFYEYILHALKIDKFKDSFFDNIMIDMVKRRTSQFEDFLMRLYDDLNDPARDSAISFLLQIFTVGYPNINHYFLADLMQKGLINTILTTNFDRLFEDAYNITFNEKYYYPKIKYITNGKCKDLSSLYEYVQEKYVSNEKIYLKLHGCITELNSISTFLPRVASKLNVDCIETEMKKILFNVDYILVMGYSFSDAYDIGKVFRNLTEEELKNSADLILINHIIDKDPEKEIYYETIHEFLEEKKDDNLCLKLPHTYKNKGYVLECNTDKFVKELWEQFSIYKSVQIDTTHIREESKRCVENYVQSLRHIRKGYYVYLHACRFHYEVGQNLFLIRYKNSDYYKLSKKALEKSILYAKSAKETIDNFEDQLFNQALAKKHLLLSELALSYEDEKKIIKILYELKVTANKVLEYPNKLPIENYIWLYSEITYFYCLWKFEFLYYGVLHIYNACFEDLLFEINKVIDIIKNHISFGFIKLVYYRLLILRARTNLGLDRIDNLNENDFAESEKELYADGRVEYLAFLYHGYAQFLSKNDSIEKSIEKYNEAIYLYNNLGDKERAAICIDELTQLENKNTIHT